MLYSAPFHRPITAEINYLIYTKFVVFVAWPASLSIMASSAAAPFVLGVPAEMYAFGTEFSLFWIGFVFGVPLITHTLFARLHRMKMVTVYEVYINGPTYLYSVLYISDHILFPIINCLMKVF